ncbi:MAG: hypothetical protein ACYST6_16785 [Planctomycetota bacterium]
MKKRVVLIVAVLASVVPITVTLFWLEDLITGIRCGPATETTEWSDAGIVLLCLEVPPNSFSETWETAIISDRGVNYTIRGRVGRVTRQPLSVVHYGEELLHLRIGESVFTVTEWRVVDPNKLREIIGE